MLTSLCCGCSDFYPRSPCGERLWALMGGSNYEYFYPRSPCGERLILHMAHLMEHLFLSTLSLRRATALGLPGWLRTLISIHALLAESDNDARHRTYHVNEFLSTLSLRRATISCAWSASKFGDFYPRSPCGERRRRSVKLFRQNYISIHALLAESDRFFFLWCILCLYISIHALLAESDIYGCWTALNRL